MLTQAEGAKTKNTSAEKNNLSYAKHIYGNVNFCVCQQMY